MSKFRSPFNSNEIFISQTSHGENANNPNDLSQQCAVDFAKTAESDVISVCDGVVEVVTSAMGSYISVIPDGANFRILYVHIYKFLVSKGQRVSRGQKIGSIMPLSTGSHLHFGLKNINGKAPHPCPMSFFDRSLTFRTNFQDIKNDWFIGDNLNWSLFPDLSYDNNSMELKKGDRIEFLDMQNIRKGSGTAYPITGVTKAGDVYEIEDGPRYADGYTWYDLKGADWVADVGLWKLYTEPISPVTPPNAPDCSEYVKHIETLQAENTKLKKELGTCKEQLEAKVEEISNLEEQIKAFDSLIEEINKNVDDLQKKYDILFVEKNRIENEKNKAIEEYNTLKSGRFMWIVGFLEKLFPKRE